MNLYENHRRNHVGVTEGYTFPAPHVAPVMMSPRSYQGMKHTYDNNTMAPIK